MAFSRHPEEGIKLLYQQFYKPLTVFANTLISDKAACEDIIQNLFYHFIKKQIYRQIPPDSLSSYLFRSVRNNCLNYLRDRKTFTDVEYLKFNAIEEEAMVFSPELVKAIRTAIDHLPEKTRQVIVSVIIQRKKYKETAQEMNISVNTVKSQLKNGLTQLRKQFPDSLLLYILLKSYTPSSCLSR